MTQEVATVSEQASFVEIARLMAVHRVSALPVVGDGGRVIGIVSEADLLRKEEYQDDQDGQHLLESRRRRIARAKAASRTRCRSVCTMGWSPWPGGWSARA